MPFGTHHLLEHELRKSGDNAPAEVTAVQQTHLNITDGNPQLVGNTELVVKLQVHVRPGDGTAFDAGTETREGQLDGYHVGDVVRVLYDPDDHTKVVVDRQATDAAAEAHEADLDTQLKAGEEAMDAARARMDAVFASPSLVAAEYSPQVSPISATEVLGVGQAVRVVVVQTAPLEPRTGTASTCTR